MGGGKRSYYQSDSFFHFSWSHCQDFCSGIKGQGSDTSDQVHYSFYWLRVCLLEARILTVYVYHSTFRTAKRKRNKTDLKQSLLNLDEQKLVFVETNCKKPKDWRVQGKTKDILSVQLQSGWALNSGSFSIVGLATTNVKKTQNLHFTFWW